MPAHPFIDFHYPGGPTAVLLVHGLTGTPSEMKITAKGLARAGYSVYGAKLAGHCGSEADLIATTAEDWLASALSAFDHIRTTHETVIVGGLSMGALLALLVARERPGQVAGCLAYAPTLFYDGWSIPKASILLRSAVTLGFGRFIRFREAYPYGIKDERLRARIVNAMEAGDAAAAGHLYMSGLSLRELLRIIARVKREAGAIRTPTLILQAREDDVASVRNASFLAARLGGQAEKILLEDSYHMITIDRERDLVVAHSLDFLRRLEARRAEPALPRAPARTGRGDTAIAFPLAEQEPAYGL
ncbi:alpha/beta fold hydrolase [Ancylobacter sp. 6x-1]|uniref:Alpha/beta fold hydrolase n=1 Tax=Ancylobacter crimeensis TaxID=2579147 RepID=A0ABT0D9W2_9HYPH|nr:alpha/beta fold hydrolase [Ancylobacter crimeensis]MCK0196736.1 alpha/beta fold hydrolase [Ancylobacter crimeensis]